MKSKSNHKKTVAALQPDPEKSSPKSSRPSFPPVLVYLALGIMALAVYLQTGGHPFFWDDEQYVTQNLHVASGITAGNVLWAFTSVEAANWHPVTWLSHMADVQFFGMDPRGHHLTNVVIHAFASLLVLLFFRRVTGSLWRSSFVAALFALHPLHVESVAWVAERKDLLSALFAFLTLLCYAEYVRKPGRLFYLLAIASFLLGLMSKPMLVTLPVLMLMLDVWPLDRYRGVERGCLPAAAGAMAREKIPFFLCSAVSSVLTIHAQHQGGAMQTLGTVSVGLRIENAVIAYVRYVGKVLWPADLAVLYPFPASYPLWQVLGALLLLVAVSLAALRAGRSRPYLAVGWFWYVVTLVPVIGLIQVGEQAMADRYSYLPAIGLFVIAAWGVADLTAGLRHRAVPLALLGGAVVCAAALLTWHQLGYWRNNIDLYRHTLAVTGGNPLINYNLGLELAREGSIDEAIREFREAIRQTPNYTEAHGSLGVALVGKGDTDGAIREYREAIRLNPVYREAYSNLGVALVKKGDLGGAVHSYREALRISPDYAEAHSNLGVAMVAQGDLDQAIREFQEALRINPRYAKARRNLELALSIKRGDVR